jgi:hypothetical protein
MYTFIMVESGVFAHPQVDRMGIIEILENSADRLCRTQYLGRSPPTSTIGLLRRVANCLLSRRSYTNDIVPRNRFDSLVAQSYRAHPTLQPELNHFLEQLLHNDQCVSFHCNRHLTLTR